MTKRFIRPFETGQIGLRLLASEDLPTTLAWRNQDRVRKHFISSRSLTPEEHRSWFESYASKDDDFVFLFSDAHELSRPVGQISLYRIDWARKTAEFGRLIVGEDQALHKGLARATTQLILNLAFDYFKLQSIILDVFESNDAAMAIYRAVGFTISSVRDGLVRMELNTDRYVRPTHSVILGSYNRPTMVRKAVESVLHQTKTSFQLIITDDGSNEATLASIRSMILGDSRCLLLHHDHQDDVLERRDCANRAVQRINDAISWVAGDIVHYLPDDDWYPRNRLEIFEDLFNDRDVVVGYGRLELVNAALDPVQSWYVPRVDDPLNVLDHKQVAHRRLAFHQIPQWPVATDWGSEGHFFRALKAHWKFHGVDRIVAYHRWHDLNMQHTRESSTGMRESESRPRTHNTRH